MNCLVMFIIGLGGLLGYNRAKSHKTNKVLGAFIGGFLGALADILLVALLLVIGPVIGNVFASAPPARSTTSLEAPQTSNAEIIHITSPAATPTTSCLRWDQITLSMRGRRVCIQGITYQVYQVNGYNPTRISFTGAPNSFFLESPDYIYYYWNNGTKHDLSNGDCVQITDIVRVFDNGQHQIPYMEISELHQCP